MKRFNQLIAVHFLQGSYTVIIIAVYHSILRSGSQEEMIVFTDWIYRIFMTNILAGLTIFQSVTLLVCIGSVALRELRPRINQRILLHADIFFFGVAESVLFLVLYAALVPSLGAIFGLLAAVVLSLLYATKTKDKISLVFLAIFYWIFLRKKLGFKE